MCRKLFAGERFPSDSGVTVIRSSPQPALVACLGLVPHVAPPFRLVVGQCLPGPPK